MGLSQFVIKRGTFSVIHCCKAYHFGLQNIYVGGSKSVFQESYCTPSWGLCFRHADILGWYTSQIWPNLLLLDLKWPSHMTLTQLRCVVESRIDKICRFYCCCPPWRCNFGKFWGVFVEKTNFYISLVLSLNLGAKVSFFLYGNIFRNCILHFERITALQRRLNPILCTLVSWG